jgi:hypothetical protein
MSANGSDSKSSSIPMSPAIERSSCVSSMRPTPDPSSRSPRSGGSTRPRVRTGRRAISRCSRERFPSTVSYCASSRPARLGGPSGIEVARSMIDDQRTASERRLRLRAVGSAMDYSYCDLETDGRSRGRDREFIGLFVRRERILQCIVLPDGADPSSLGAHLDFHVRAIPRSRARTTERWRDVPITLRISDPRYEPMRETFTLHRGFPRFELRARSAAK